MPTPTKTRTPAKPVPTRTPTSSTRTKTESSARPPQSHQQQPSALVPTPRQTTPVVMDELMEEMLRDEGLGVSTLARDNITPNIVVMQPQSPLVLEGGARPGDFLMTNGDPPVVDGEEGFFFQPCCTTEWWFEFIPRDDGGGFVARYPVEYTVKGEIVPPPGAELKDPGNNRFHFWFPETGNECTHYRFIPGIRWRDLGVGEEYVIQFHGTGHTVARSWNTAWTRKRAPNGKLLPAAGTVYRVRTAQRSNKKGTWYSIVYDGGTYIGSLPDLIGGRDESLVAYRRGKDLAMAFKQGEKVEGVYQESDDDAGTDGGKQQADQTSQEDLPY